MLDKLEMFIALARERHFGRAAESLNLSQPTLSANIKQLEEILGTQLVFRGSRFGGLTPEGQSALSWARRIVADSRQMRDELRAKRHGLAGEVRLAVIPTALTWAANLSSEFSKTHPRVRFTILSRTSREILAMLENFEVDAGISYLDNEPLGRVDTLPIYREDYMAVCGTGHPLAQGKRASWADLDGIPLALLTPDMQNRRIVDQRLAEAGARAGSCIESNSIVVLIASALAGKCVAILPTDMARFLATGHDLALLPLDARGTGHSVGLILPHRDPRTPVLEALNLKAEVLARDGQRLPGA